MTSPRNRKTPNKELKTPKLKCEGQCKLEKQETRFYKSDSPLFPSGRINICSTCASKEIDENDIETVIKFLRQIDKPFIESVWNGAVLHKNNSLGEYMRQINSLSYRGKTFEDSDNMNGMGKTSDIQSAKINVDTIDTVKGVLEYSDDLISKWGIGYKKHEYLQMEKFYVDMKETHEINTSIHIDQLKQLAYLSVERDRLRQSGEWGDYERISKTMELMLKSAGFRPIDRKSGAEATGIFSFAQVWAEIEKEGFITPNMVEYDKDDIDYMLLYFVQFTQRLVGKSVSVSPPSNWRNEIVEDEDLVSAKYFEDTEYDEDYLEEKDDENDE